MTIKCAYSRLPFLLGARHNERHSAGSWQQARQPALICLSFLVERKTKRLSARRTSGHLQSIYSTLPAWTFFDSHVSFYFGCVWT